MLFSENADLMKKLKNLNILKVENWISAAWDEVEPLNIVKLWRI